MTRAKPVLFLDHTSTLGGAELSVARYLRADDAIPSVLGVLSPEDVTAWDLPDRIAVRQTRATAGVDSIPRVVSELRTLIDEVDPDCIIANSYSAAQYLAFVPKHGRKYLYFLRQEALPSGLGRMKSALNRAFILRRFDGFFANSHWTASTLPSFIAATRPVIVSHPISGIAVAAQPRRLDPGRSIRLLTLSRLSPWKGIDTAIEAVRLLEESGFAPATLSVVGGDLFGEKAHSQHLRELAAGRDVLFAGQQTDTVPFLQSADVLLCLSKTPEPFGQVIVQGMAHGCVVIATDQGGPREIIEDGVDGILVPPDSPGSVRDAIVRLQNEPDWFASISANALRAARSYADEVTIERFTDDIDALMTRVR